MNKKDTKHIRVNKEHHKLLKLHASNNGISITQVIDEIFSLPSVIEKFKKYSIFKVDIPDITIQFPKIPQR